MNSKERTLGTRASIFKKTDKIIPELDQATNSKQQEKTTAKQQRIKILCRHR